MSQDPEEVIEELTPEYELAEYFIQCRENDINKLTPKSIFKINIMENAILPVLLQEEREKFRTVIRKALIKAYSTYKIDEERAELIERITEIFSDVKIEIKIPRSVNINEIKAEKHEGKIITFPCEIFAVAQPKTITIRELFKCSGCNEETIEQTGRRQCPKCRTILESQGIAESETVRIVTLKDINSADISVTTFMANTHREISRLVEPNQKVMITGIFKSIPIGRRSNLNNILIDVINIESLAEDKTVKPDPLTLQTYKDLAKHGKLIDKLIDSYAWHIEGNREAKLACMLYLTGGVEEDLYRGRIHIGFVGDPATAKSEIAKWMLRITPNSGLTDGTGSSGVGLGAGMVKLPNGTAGMVSGPLVKHNNGFVFVDELDKMEKDQYEMLLGIMEDGRCRRTLAGVDIDLPAYTSLIICANPIAGRWDMENPAIGVNINLSAPLLSRFDLLFRFLQIANVEKDLKITRHIQKSRQGKPKDILSEEELTAFFNYVRELKPKMPTEAEEIIIQFYIQREKFQLDKDSISMDQRQYGALVRLSYAFAKLLFKHTVDEECVNLAISIYKKSVASFGILLEAGGSTAEASKWFANPKESKERAFRTIFKKLEEDHERVFRKELIEVMAELKQWKSSEDAHSYINIMYSKGDITEQPNGELKLVD